MTRILTTVPTKDNELFKRWLAIDDDYAVATRHFIAYCRANDCGPVEAYPLFAKDLDEFGYIDRKGQKHHYRASTYNGKIIAIRKRIRWMFKHTEYAYTIKEIPFEDYLSSVKLKKLSVPIAKCLTWDEVRTLVAACKSTRIAILIEFLAQTGIRISEAIGILQTDVVCTGKNCDITIRGKGSKERVVSARAALIERVNKIFGGKKWLFEHNGQPYNRTSLTGRIQKAGRQAFGPTSKISAHWLRHTWATTQLKIKDDKSVAEKMLGISERLGHSDISTTLRYYGHARMDDDTACLDL